MLNYQSDIKYEPRIKLVWADGGFQGDDLANWVAELLTWSWQVILRKDDIKGFVVIPKRWVVERTFAWLSFNRRLSKDYEKHTQNSESMRGRPRGLFSYDSNHA